MNSHNTARRLDRHAKRSWVPLAMMSVSPLAQRTFTPSWADELVKEFDLEQLGIFVVSRRDGRFWVIDGQHRKAALEQMGYGDQQVECEVYENLTEAEEAEMFLRRNNKLTVTSLAKFKVGVTAGRPVETAIDQIVRDAGLRVAGGKAHGTVSAVGTLTRVYLRDGDEALARVLAIIRDAYGVGFEAPVLDGFGMLVHRYDRDLKDAVAVAKLRTAMGGVNGLLGRADLLARTHAATRAQCVAAAAVDLINRGPGGKKLTPWWRTGEDTRP